MTAGEGAGVELVPARRAPSTPVRRLAFDESVLRSLWFVPACFALGAAVLSRASLALDRWLEFEQAPEAILPGDPTALAAMAATVAAAMLTFLGVVFSTTLVAVQLAGSQYSPRIVRVFVRSRLTHITLGVFLATFVFSLNTLVGTRETVDPVVPAITVTLMYVLVLATVLTFVVFLHGMVRLLRVQYLLRLIAIHSHEVLDETFPAADAYEPAPRPAPGTTVVEVRNEHPGPDGRRGTPRVLQAVDRAALADAARAAGPGCWIEMGIAIGEHAGPGKVVARIHDTAPSRLQPDDVRSHLLFGSERTLLQDPAFGFRQLVDTASRALSPAINDPTTGVQALHRVADLLARIGTHPDPTGWYTDGEGTVRLRLLEDHWDRLAALGLTEILRYGADAPQVTRALLAIYDDLDQVVAEDRRAVIAALRSQCLEAIGQTMPEAFRAGASVPDRRGLG